MRRGLRDKPVFYFRCRTTNLQVHCLRVCISKGWTMSLFALNSTRKSQQLTACKDKLNRYWKVSLPSLHHWVGHAVVLLQSLTVHAPRYVFFLESVSIGAMRMVVWGKEKGTTDSPQLWVIHNINHSRDKHLHWGSRYCPGRSNNSPKPLVQVLCRSRWANSTTAERPRKANKRWKPPRCSYRNASMTSRRPESVRWSPRRMDEILGWLVVSRQKMWGPQGGRGLDSTDISPQTCCHLSRPSSLAIDILLPLATLPCAARYTSPRQQKGFPNVTRHFR